MSRFAAEPADLNVSQCVLCRHARPGGGCAAFPGAIPDAILLNRHDHRRPYPGDGGVRFETIVPADGG